MTEDSSNDWNPGAYLRFRGLRLRPALDLLGAVGALPPGEIVDLGCGTGVMAAALSSRFPGRDLIGVDGSPRMLAEAATAGGYRALIEADAAEWAPDVPPALIFSNALLQWLPRHDLLMPRLVSQLAPGGTLAVQMPRQFEAPSHSLLRKIAGTLFPDRFDFDGWQPPVAPPAAYAELLRPLGELSLWETTYFQRLEPVETGHPVRAFTISTAARPILEKLDPAETQVFLASYDASLDAAYPAAEDGSVLFPFQRLFLVVTKP